MKIETLLVKAFTKDPDKGNPAGVTLNAGGLTDAQMLHIASELGFSESAFVSKSNKADFRVRFFSPKEEVDLCGHNTIATFYTLVNRGIISVDGESVTVTQETNAGILPVICFADGKTVMTQSNPVFGDLEKDKAGMAGLLSINPADILDQAIQTISTGMPKTMIPITSLEALKRINPNAEELKKYCLEHNSKGLYPFTRETYEPEDDFHARQFNPFSGVREDPVTGIAAGALGAYLRKHNLLEKPTFIIEQGNILGKDGKMYVDVTDGIRVGGYGAIFGQRTFEL